MDQGGGNFRARYSDAYGNYQGGYGPRGGYPGFGQFGPPPLMGGPMRGPPMGPRGMMGPEGPGFFGPPFGFQGVGPMRPINPVKFLKRCGVKASDLQNVPKSILRLCLPKHCGICNMDIDTFAFARMHYMSKNHLKKQRKWLLVSSDNTNETPMKSRDLYCELCDVQITSKPHADSHYAGKSHNAIVLGRKPPKNAKLLLAGAEARLEKLLKREQRFAKSDLAAVGPAAASAKSKEGPKSTEFYCEICKSAMSCSEQMTAHLNGKRHLTKEKQHILQSMKQSAAGEDTAEKDTEDKAEENGDAAAENGAEGNGVEEVEEVEDVDEVEYVEEVMETAEAGGEGGGGQEDDSWVHGTGEGWEDTSKTGV